MRVLVIDDDRKLSEMLEEYLRPRGLSAELAFDGAQGLALAARGSFDAVILDVMLPDLDGFEVCKRLRAVSDVPILMLTARGDPEDRVVGLELGADDYLPKPFNPRELLARVHAITRRRHVSRPLSAPILRFGDLEIDPEARLVMRKGTPRALTSYQFDILLLLARNAGRVMSREAIVERLRREEYDVFDRSIDVHVSRIRMAIEEDPKHPRRLLTIRGTGYQFTRLPGDREP
ncbi:MAG: response regulator transcription factor [Thermoanaerobaculia bacterium]|nr:response regulator transcription factor [Thermoanaerobaculia bacterium]